MTDNKTNNQDVENPVVEEAKETYRAEATTENAVSQGEYVADQYENTVQQGERATDQEGCSEQMPLQDGESENTQSFADKIDLDEKVAATKNFLSEFWDFIKVCFTQSFPQGVKRASTEKKLFWIVIMAVNAIFMGLFILVAVKKLLAPITSMGIYGSSRSLIPGGLVFLMGFLASLLFFWIAVGGTAGLLAICKKKFSFQGLCNVVAIAWLPMTMVCIANVLIGLIYAPFAMLLSIVAQIMFYILLYMGVQSLAKFQKSPFLWFSLMLLVMLIIFMLIFGVITDAISSSMVSSVMSGFSFR